MKVQIAAFLFVTAMGCRGFLEDGPPPRYSSSPERLTRYLNFEVPPTSTRFVVYSSNGMGEYRLEGVASFESEAARDATLGEPGRICPPDRDCTARHWFQKGLKRSVDASFIESLEPQFEQAAARYYGDVIEGSIYRHGQLWPVGETELLFSFAR